MDFKIILAILRRRWYVAAPVFMLAIIVALAGPTSPVYQVRSSFLLVAPSAGSNGSPGNVLLESSSGVNSVASVAVVLIESESVREDVAAAGFSKSYDFSVSRFQPFVTLDVAASNEDLVVSSALALSRSFIENVANQQLRFGVEPGSLVKAELLGVDEPVADYSSVRTRQAVLIGLGVVVALILATAVEGIAYRRRESKLVDVGSDKSSEEDAAQERGFPSDEKVGESSDGNGRSGGSESTAPTHSPATSGAEVGDGS